MHKNIVMYWLKMDSKITLNGTNNYHGKLSFQNKDIGLEQRMIIANDE